MTSSLFCFVSAALLTLKEEQLYLFGQIQTSQTGGQPYSDTSPFGECSLVLGDRARLKQKIESSNKSVPNH